MLFLRDIDVDVQLRCRACGHGGILPRSILERRFGPNYPVLSIAPHYRCSRCEARDTESRPAVPDRFAGDAAPPSDDVSFDAPLAALQGLLASVRGSEKPAAARAAASPPPASPPPWSGLEDPEDSLPAFKPFVAPKPLVAATGPAAVELAANDVAETDWGETDWDEPPPVRSPAFGKATRDLEELAADGPADADARPLWEPVSLADMAARLDSHRGEPAGEADVDPAGRDAAAAGADEGPLDETLAAMRRFFADADLADADPEEETGRPAALKPAPVDDDKDGDDDSALPPVFSHKVFARTDFDDSDEEWDEVDVSGDEAGWGADEAGAETGEEEPADEDIVAFAIRDPERPAAPPKAERAAKPVPANDGDGFDRTLAALRSMIEDAAVEPAPVPIRRKTRPSAEPPAPPDEPKDPGHAGAESDGPDVAVPDEPPAVKAPGKAGRAAKAGGSPKRSAQEREIEEAMRALRDLVEDDDPPLSKPLPVKPLPAKPAVVVRPSFGRAEEFPAADSAEEAPMELSPEKPAPPAGKKRAEADGDSSPLSKTIAALRGMLELDGRRKR
ncbi:hypothetical protein J2847_003034 [Azospirillum agricola]|uniref:hypothetical protein n=1 Tax=Azospirillum agricola TaxID=1720247 RepID=UPI001AE26162|nr:hypothetical protein [Azospirillum agricola]MBP2229735.1 hypothetical protein [Azospirillum agricola]